MNSIKNPFLILICLFAFTGVLTAGDLPNWRSDATGYYLAQKEAISSDKPLIVYFKADWCGYCKKLDANYLSTFQFNNFLYNIPKVVINPEKGQQEKALAKQYGVTGYPSFFVMVPGLSGGKQNLQPFFKNSCLSVNEYLDKIKNIISGYYDEEGFRLMRLNKFTDAIDYFETALTYNRSDDYAYGCIGICYHNIANERRDISMIQKAIDYYEISLRLNPDQQNIQNNLKQLTSARH